MKINNKGFTLIELSIVLIIIGLLIAGITGGASLIKTAQLRSIITEYNSYKTSYNTYYGQYNLVPNAAAATPTQVGSATTGTVIAQSTATWTDMQTKGITTLTPGSNGGVASKYKNTYWFITYGATDADVTAVITDFTTNNLLIAGTTINASGETATSTGSFVNADAVSIDTKLDDGFSDTGSTRIITAGGTIAYDGPTSSNNTVSTSTTTDDNIVFKMDF